MPSAEKSRDSGHRIKGKRSEAAVFSVEHALNETKITGDVAFLCEEFKKYSDIPPELYENANVKRGLRNADGTGVLAGLTKICNVHGYLLDEGELLPVDGKLTYRGYNVSDFVRDCIATNRYGFEEICWLLLFGSLPGHTQLARFTELLAKCRELPEGFNEDMIFTAPSQNIMNKLARSVLALYSYDANPDECSLENILRQSIQLIARMPTIMVSSYQIKRRYYDRKSMYFHQTKAEFSTAQNILRTLRSDKQFTEDEAHLLDLCLMLHAEHGGGNNSTFACRVLSSSGTDTYSAIAAAIGALKGPRHGGANLKVLEMMEYVKESVTDWKDEGQIKDVLAKILRKEGGDGSGLIYGIGHAVYTKSDPRAILLREQAEHLASVKGYGPVLELYERVERLAPQVFADFKGGSKSVCANVDFYSGLIYEMLSIPPELFTPLFAISRISGWCAHRIEEVTTCGRIIRPAYKPAIREREYVSLGQRGE
ncbi:MAG: citrate/2-methylcitrate synthase [Oscillospiraceae bacterium]|jgi:citrate synthase|nr:citrate/2-methylcitrate synthase [Oscillospiraceae bacterium]